MSARRKRAGQLKSRTSSKVKGEDPSALHQSEVEETRKESLIKKLRKGERSGFVLDFDRDAFLMDLHRKHSTTGGN